MAGAVIPFSLHGSGSGVLSEISVKGSEHRALIEGHPAFGGTESHLSPLDLALSALIACTQVTGKIVATSMRGVTLGEWSIDLESNLDNSVLVFGEQGVSNFGDVQLIVDVQTSMTDEEFGHFTAEVERRCPITSLFRDSGVRYKTTWTNTPLPSA